MPVVSRREFERLLRGLDSAEFRAFVADLWAARGVDPVVSDGLVVVTDPVTRADRTILTLARRSGRAAPSKGSRPVDVVVSASDSGRSRSVAARLDARFVGPDDLRAMALYGAPREDCEVLFRRYFDRPVNTVTTPRNGSLGRPSLPFSLDTALTVVLLGLVVVAGVGITFLDSDQPRPAETSGRTESVLDQPTPGPVRDAPGATDEPKRYPPGIGPEGVTDATVLAQAHDAWVSGESYQLHIAHGGSVDADTGERWVGAWEVMWVANESTYLWSQTGYRSPNVTAPADVRSPGVELVQRSEYADGTHRYRRLDGPDGPVYERTGIPKRVSEGASVDKTERYVERYLATSESRLEPSMWDLFPYQVVATGDPVHIEENVSNYSARALVNEDGIVVTLRVVYDLHVGNETSVVSFSFEYGRFEETRARPPSWYDEAINATADAGSRGSGGRSAPGAYPEMASADDPLALPNRTAGEVANDTASVPDDRPP